MEKEVCHNCDCETGGAGKGDDSIYVILHPPFFASDDGGIEDYGPLCEGCYDALKQLNWIIE